jgi:N-acetylglucosaminyl-diphospho-decaprenol L-rhamnosyltransferase
MSTLSIVIVNWNSKDYLDHCLQSIAKTAKDLNPEIIVVDGGSFDGCDIMLAKKHKNVRFIQSEENIGFGRSNNLGIKAATGDIVALLNPDTELRPESLQELINALETHPDCGAVGPRLINADGTLQKSCVQAFPTPLNQALDSDFLRNAFPRSGLWKTYDAFHQNNPSKVEVLSGACIVAWRETLNSIGGFSDDYFMYAEDMDLCKKIHELNQAIYHVPESEITHFGGGSSSTQFSNFAVVMNLESLELYMRLRHGQTKALLFRFLMGVSAAVRFGLIKLVLLLKRSRSSPSLMRWQAQLSWARGKETWTIQYRFQTTQIHQETVV